MAILKGGYPIYGKSIGIIMLDCSFPRPLGDIGNARTFPFPVHYEVLEGVPAQSLTRHGEKSAVDSLLEAAKKLERMGVRAITTSCGLLIRYQSQLSRVVSVPVATSSLLLLPLLGAVLPEERKIGVITADAGSLDSDALRQAGWDDPKRIVIRGMEGCEVFKKAIMDPGPPFDMDTERLCNETVSVAGKLLSEEKKIAALLLECTNLAPYSSRLRRAFSLPVYDLTHLVFLLHASTNEEAPPLP